MSVVWSTNTPLRNAHRLTDLLVEPGRQIGSSATLCAHRSEKNSVAFPGSGFFQLVTWLG